MSTRKSVPQNPFTLSFSNPLLEADFCADHQEKSLTHLRWDLVVGLVLYGIFGIHDYWVIPEIRHYAWTIRFAAVCPLLLGILLLTYTAFFRKIQQLCIYFAGLAAGGGIVMMIIKASPPGNYTYYAGLLLILLFFFRQRFITSAALSWSTVVLYEIVALQDPSIPASVLFSNTFVLSTFSLTGTYMSYTLEQHIRNGFLLRRTIQEQNRDIATANKALQREVTERRQAESAIQDQMEFLRTLLDTIPTPIFYTDFHGRRQGCNRAYEQFFNRNRRTCPNWQLIEPHLASLIQNTTSSAQEKSDPNGVITREVVLEHADGSRRVTLFSRATYCDRSGKAAGIVGAVLDISELKRVEEEKLRLESHLFQTQKIEALGQLAGGIAHEFNNILTAIIGYAHLLQKHIEEGDPRRFFVDNTIASGERAARLIRDILAFGRKQRIEPRQIDLNQIIGSSHSLLSMMIGENIELHITTASSPLPVAADENLISQVLVNLAANARDAMPKGGSLIISTTAACMDQQFTHAHGSAQPGTYGLITVTDSGIGMDQKTKERIFEPFFTTKEVGKGTGLGLSIAHGIIKQHNGYIDTESHFAGGTTFRIYLPLIPCSQEKTPRDNHNVSQSLVQQPVAAANQIQPDEGFPSGTETILVAEDNDTVRILTRNLLQENGYRVLEARHGDDALQRFMENADEIRLLLLDVLMPKKNGWEVYEMIRKIRPGIKVIFMSGYTADVFDKRLIPEQGVPLMGKPIPPGDLLRALRRELDPIGQDHRCGQNPEERIFMHTA